MDGLDHRDTVTDFDLPQDTFFDCATIHLLTTATLDRLRELYPRGRVEVRRFQPNIVAETADLNGSRCDAAQPGEPGDRGESIVGAGPGARTASMPASCTTAGASGLGGPGRRRMTRTRAGQDDAAGGDTLIATCHCHLFAPPIGGDP
jgi:hypothetical protein